MESFWISTLAIVAPFGPFSTFWRQTTIFFAKSGSAAQTVMGMAGREANSAVPENGCRLAQPDSSA